MKLLKSISRFMAGLGLLAIGCFLGFESKEFFYPGAGVGQAEENVASDAHTETVQASTKEENVISADTSFVVIEVNMADKSEKAESIPVPTYYMGMDRADFEKQIQTYDSSPSLLELQKGFQGSEIRSFSGSKVELCKFYQIQAEETDEYYYLAIFKNKVVVYKSDGKTIYMETDIPAEDLPADVMQELIQRRVVNTEEDLYDFLESYSS